MVPPTEPCALRSTQPLKVSKGGRCVWLTTYHPCSAETLRKSGALTYPELLGPPRPVAGHLKKSLFRSRLLSRGTNIQLYKTLIRPVVSYGAEIWTVTKKEQALLIFERKIYRRQFGPKYETGEWKRRTNRELEEMSKGENVV